MLNDESMEICINIIDKFFQAGISTSFNPSDVGVIREFKELGGLEIISKVIGHPKNEKVAEKANELIRKYSKYLN